MKGINFVLPHVTLLGCATDDDLLILPFFSTIEDFIFKLWMILVMTLTTKMIHNLSSIVECFFSRETLPICHTWS